MCKRRRVGGWLVDDGSSPVSLQRDLEFALTANGDAQCANNGNISLGFT
jgi:hypothetical protein